MSERTAGVRVSGAPWAAPPLLPHSDPAALPGADTPLRGQSSRVHTAPRTKHLGSLGPIIQHLQVLVYKAGQSL